MLLCLHAVGPPPHTAQRTALLSAACAESVSLASSLKASPAGNLRLHEEPPACPFAAPQASAVDLEGPVFPKVSHLPCSLKASGKSCLHFASLGSLHLLYFSELRSDNPLSPAGAMQLSFSLPCPRPHSQMWFCQEASFLSWSSLPL